MNKKMWAAVAMVMSMASVDAMASNWTEADWVAVTDNVGKFVSQRPKEKDRLFKSDPIYQNTRRFVWSDSNPYFFQGSAGEGIGGPHVGYGMVWPMSIMMKAFTSQCDDEIKDCVKMLMTTDAGTGFMHESFHKDNPKNFTRAWFAWQNTLFGELIIKLVNDGKLDVLNSITLP